MSLSGRQLNPEKGEHPRRNTEQDDKQCHAGSARKYIRALFLHIFIGPGSEKLNDLTHIHVVYLLFLLSFVLTTSSLYISEVRRRIELELRGCINNSTGGEHPERAEQCQELASAESIALRLGFSFSVALFTFSLLTLKPPQNGVRARIHQGFWLAKFVFILCSTTASLFIPRGGEFDFVWTAVSLCGALLFQIFQSVLILDFSTSASDVFVTKITEERSRSWYVAWLLSVWLIYFTAIVVTAVLYAMFMDSCGTSGVLVSAVVILSALSAIVTVQFSEHGTGLIHSGFTTLYVLFLTLVTLEQETVCREQKVKPMNEPEETELVVEPFKMLFSTFSQIILGFLSVSYAALRSYNARHFCYGNSVIVCERNDEAMNDEATNAEAEEREGIELRSRESADNPRFSPSLFYFVLGKFSLFVTSTVTTLSTSSSEHATPVINNMTTFYLRSSTILVIAFMVIWTQIYPVLFPSEKPFNFLALHRTLCRFLLRTSRRVLIDGCVFCNGATESRCIFTFLFLLGLSFACSLYAPVVRRSLSANHYFCATAGLLGNCLSTDPAYMAVYRICFAMATFYLLFAVILVCVDNTRDTRVDLQYKAWPVKFCLFFSLLVSSFLLPKEFNFVWIYATLMGTLVFTVLQLALLIHWTKHMSKKLEKKVETSSSSFWPALLTISTTLLFLLCLAAVVVFYVFFTGFPLCLTNRIFISLNLVLAIIASVTSVHPKIYDAGLFQCSIIVVFSVYLTWSGLSHNPDVRCNPVAGYVGEQDTRPNLNIQAAVDLCFTVVTVVYFSAKVPALTDHLRELCERIRRRQLSTRTHASMESQSPTGDTDCPVYNFSLFHFVYFVASLNATTILTNWYIPNHGSRFKVTVNWAAMCVKMTTACLSLVIYIWSIAAQLVTD